jgi:hypothetical protein
MAVNRAPRTEFIPCPDDATSIYATYSGDYLGALATPIERAAISYQGLDLNETLLIRFVDDSLDFFVGCLTEDF